MRQTLLITFGGLIAFAISAGCSGPNAQVARCQTEKQELLSVIEQEKVHSKALQERALALESRLDQSEKQLAQFVRPGSRFGEESESRMASSKAAKPLETTPPAKDKSTHESPPSSGAADPAAKIRTGLREMKLQAPAHGSADGKSRLASLAERDTRLEFDPAMGTARLKVDIPFDADGAGLTAEGRRRLDEVAAWLKSSQTSDLRVLVAGYSSGMKKPPAGSDAARFANDRQLGAARAMAVADYLDRHGIKEDRLAVIGSGAKGSLIDAPKPGSVEIMLAEPETPVAGLRPTGTIRR